MRLERGGRARRNASLTRFRYPDKIGLARILCRAWRRCRDPGAPALDDHGRGALERSDLDFRVDQVAHLRIAGARAVAAKYDGDDMMSLAADIDRDVETGVADIAGLDAIDAIHLTEQVIMVAHPLAVPDKKPGREIAIEFRETVLQGAREDRLVAGGRDLEVVRQARSVVIIGTAHAERMGF